MVWRCVEAQGRREGGGRGVEIRRGWLQVTSVFEACIKSERGEVA